MIKTATRTVAVTEVARIKAALIAAAVRFAIQVDGEVATIIYFAAEAREAADAIAAEMTR